MPDERKLTVGQTYHWSVEAITDGQKKIVVPDETLNTPLPTYGGNKFSSVTILTRGAELNGVAVDNEFRAMAQHIAQLDVLGVPDTQQGLVLDYNADTGKWDKDGTTSEVTVDELNNDLGKSLVLLTGWSTPNSAIAFNSGASEAAADTFYASLVQLDQMLGGGIGDGAGNIYDNTGKLIRDQGKLFNSYLHFIGFGQGAVVDDEIIQRLGTDYPLAGGVDKDDRDLQMTTIDPQDFQQDSLKGRFVSLNEPKIQIWKNITFADNYYQEFSANGKTDTRMGEAITGADLNVDLSDYTGFGVDDGKGGLHDRALAWYAGTLNLTGSTIPSLGNEKVYRRLGDLEPDQRSAISESTWYTPDYAGYKLKRGAVNNPSEGIGTGWFYSALGGGKDLRPYGTARQSKQQLGDFEQYLNNNRTLVSVDNTATANMRGDYAVPTLFDGNFDAVTNKLDGQYIPG
ncbi:MAG: hypothetical protein V7L04_18495 [Nostoc sp.]|uniref:hypothetical protein n=1 Tax=Nostoc sp. TaxID=1180 RepID=UPI002FFC5A06